MLFPDTGNLLPCGQRLVAGTGRGTGEPWEPEQMRAPSQQTIRLTKNTEILRRQLTTTSTSFTPSSTHYTEKIMGTEFSQQETELDLTHRPDTDDDDNC